MLDYEKAISTKELIRAAHQCARGVRWKASISQWMFFCEANCATLHCALKNGTYKISPYGNLHLISPKPRDIKCTRFVDRVVQRSLLNNGLYDALSKPLLSTNGACLLDKGISCCIKALERNLQHIYFSNNQMSNDFWYVIADIKKFFDNTPHSVVKEEYYRYVPESNFRMHIDNIIDTFIDRRSPEEVQNDPFGERGMILGSAISQLLQLVVLNRVDHYMSNLLTYKTYIRYMDDIVMLAPTKEEAQQLLDILGKQLQRKGFTLNKKSHIGCVKDGIKFLKVHFKLTNTGKVIRKLDKKVFGKELQRTRTLLKKYKDGNLSSFALVQHFNSWFGSNAFKMKRSQLRKAKQYVEHVVEEIYFTKSK